MTQQTMRIARFRGFQKGFVLEETEKPSIKENEVLIRTTCCAISGTDVYRYRENKDPVIPPFADGDTPGHEIAGTVEDVGGTVTRCNPGDRVVVQPFWGCGTCSACNAGRENFCPHVKAFGFHVPGGFSEYISAREEIVLRFASHITFDEAVLTHHIAVNLNGIKSAGVEIGEASTVAVFGTGNLGLLMVMMIKALGASKIFAVDIEPSRLALASQLSGSIPVNAVTCDPAETILKETGGRGVDVSIELAGGSAPTLDQAMNATKKGGIFVAIAVRNEKDSLNFRRILSRSLRVQGSATHTMTEMGESLAMIEDGSIQAKRIITHSFPFHEINRSFDCRLDDPKALYVMVHI